MSSIQIIPIPSIQIIENGDDILSILFKSMDKIQLKFQDHDILVIASKVVAFNEGNLINFSNVKVTDLSKKIAKKAKIPPEFAQVILDECNCRFIGTVPGAITTINDYGLLANAGADQSNVGVGRIVLLPKNIKKSAKYIFHKIKEKTGNRVSIIIADSRTMPMRLGTVGCALGTYGFESVIDERGKNDLFNRPMHITTRAIADQLATAAELVMGETDEQIPFVIIRNYEHKIINEEAEKDINKLISAQDCMFIGPLLSCIEKKIEEEISND